MQKIGSKLFGGLVVIILGALVYFTLFSDGLGQGPKITVEIAPGQSIELDKPMKPVLVNFWATTCPGCIKEMPQMADMKKTLGDRFELIAISMNYDPAEQVDKFIAKNPYPFVFIKDTDGAYAKAFGDVLLTPTSFLIAPNGKIVYRHIGEIHFAQVTERIKQMSPQFN